MFIVSHCLSTAYLLYHIFFCLSRTFFEVFQTFSKMKFCHPCWRLDYFIISSFICQHLFYLFFASFLLCHTILYTYFFEACFSIPFLSTLRQAPFCINFSDTFAAFYMAYCRYHHLIAIFKVVLTTIQLYT